MAREHESADIESCRHAIRAAMYLVKNTQHEETVDMSYIGIETGEDLTMESIVFDKVMGIADRLFAASEEKRASREEPASENSCASTIKAAKTVLKTFVTNMAKVVVQAAREARDIGVFAQAENDFKNIPFSANPSSPLTDAMLRTCLVSN